MYKRQVPIVLASGDLTFTRQFRELVNTRTVVTKEAVGSLVAQLHHPAEVHQRLRATTHEALEAITNTQPLDVTEPVTVRIRFATTTRADILQSIPGVSRIDGITVAYEAQTMTEAYKLIRLMYKFVSW